MVFLARAGQCAVPANAGIYVVIDPYNSSNLANLQNAASAGCSSATVLTTPFCGASGTQYVSGVYLRVHWCSWELANVALGALPNQSCYYFINKSGGIPVGTQNSDTPSTAADQWSIFYLYQEVADLLTSGTVAQTAAKWAFTQTGAGTTPNFTNQISVTWTGLTEPPSEPSYNFFTDPENTTEQSSQQVGCALNNILATPPPSISYTLNGAAQNVVGVGTGMTWQTNSGPLGSTYCTVPYNPSGGTGGTEYGPILTSGALNGGITIEIFPDVAFASDPTTGFTGYLQQCGQDLAGAVTSLQSSASLPGVCLY